MEICIMRQSKDHPGSADQIDFVDMRELLHRWPVSRATVYRAIKRGELARPVRISARRVAWPKPIIEKFLGAFIPVDAREP